MIVGIFWLRDERESWGIFIKVGTRGLNFTGTKEDWILQIFHRSCTDKVLFNAAMKCGWWNLLFLSCDCLSHEGVACKSKWLSFAVFFVCGRTDGYSFLYWFVTIRQQVQHTGGKLGGGFSQKLLCWLLAVTTCSCRAETALLKPH